MYYHLDFSPNLLNCLVCGINLIYQFRLFNGLYKNDIKTLCLQILLNLSFIESFLKKALFQLLRCTAKHYNTISQQMRQMSLDNSNNTFLFDIGTNYRAYCILETFHIHNKRTPFVISSSI